MAYKCSDHHFWNTEDVLGQGATCVVFKGISEQGEVRALKVFTESHTQDQHREEKALRELNHPNIVSFYGIETERITRGRVLVTEYCDGGSLFQFLCEPENAFGLSDSDFLTVLHHLTLGLQHLREHGFVHRDIKPGNILRCLDDRGKSVFKLSDFGTARPLTDNQNFQSLVGTEEYLHPQIYQAAFFDRRGNREFHSATDLWSLGCTLYHAATGKVPFRPHQGRHDKTTMFNMISKKPTGAISGVQTSAGGPVKWDLQLPPTCPLSEGLQRWLQPMLAGLLEIRGGNLWTYEKYFDTALAIVKKKRLVVLCAVADKHHFRSVYVEPHEGLPRVREELSRQCGISARQQTLLLQDDVMTDDKWPSLHQFPATTPRSPIVLLSRQHDEHPQLNPVHAVCSEGQRLRFRTDFHQGHEFRQSVESDYKVAKQLTEFVALMCSQVRVMTMYQQEVLRVRQMLRAKLRTRSDAVERRMTSAQSLLQQLDSALQSTASPQQPLSAQLSHLYNKVSEALQWTKVDFPMEQQSLIKHEHNLDEIEWCSHNECAPRMKRLLEQAKELMKQFYKRRSSMMRAPNKPTQLMMHRDRVDMDGLYKKAFELWQDHCCKVTTDLMDNLHNWYSSHVDADQRLERREAETERLSLDIASNLPVALQAAASAKSTKNSLSTQLVQQILDIPVGSPVSQYFNMAETLNSLKSLTDDLPDVYVPDELQEELKQQQQEEKKEEQQKLEQQKQEQEQEHRQEEEQQKQQQQQQEEEARQQQQGKTELQQEEKQQEQQQEGGKGGRSERLLPPEKGQGEQECNGFVGRLEGRAAGEEESLPYMDASSLEWDYISKDDIPSSGRGST